MTFRKAGAQPCALCLHPGVNDFTANYAAKVLGIYVFLRQVDKLRFCVHNILPLQNRIFVLFQHTTVFVKMQ